MTYSLEDRGLDGILKQNLTYLKNFLKSRSKETDRMAVYYHRMKKEL